MTKSQQAERQEAIESLRESLKPGDTVYTILRSCSRSGMSRVIDLVVKAKDGELHHIGFLAARAMDDRYDRQREGIKIGGCGMDMGFSLVYNLSSTLFRDGFECTGKGDGTHGSWCPSNEHSNGDRDYTPHTHKSGGYALKQRWL